MRRAGRPGVAGERGFALVLVAAVLMVITMLGLSAVMFSTGEMEGAATGRQREAARYCAELAMARLAADLSNPAAMLDQAVPVFGSGTLALPAGSSTATYEYWVGHYGQRSAPLTLLEPISTTVDLGTVNTTSNMSNALGGQGGQTVRNFSLVVTCRSPSGTEVELQALAKRGIQ